ncbi:sodium:solute symporter family protein [Brevibacillus ginsengisoli]|uniref:sodium:solute symporter family protein n=1 Tax=Brevibacillus ginsengisoli TaxID=363854 RepID=UPI003CE84E72
MVSSGFLIGFCLVLLLTVWTGIAAKRQIHKASDFTNASGTLRVGTVMGALVGGFVGGTSIIGTGEMAFRHGLTAVWFTLGGGLAIILLGVFAGQLRAMQVETLPALVGKLHGQTAQLGASIFLSLGMFIQLIAQILAALPVLNTFGQASTAILAIVPAVLILAYVLLGGFIGASQVGSLKTVLLLTLLVGTGIYFADILPFSIYQKWYVGGKLSLVSSGAGSVWAQGGAMLIGVFSTQAYLQPVFAAKSTKDARNGSFMAGIIIIIIGLLSAWIGMFMHEHNPELAPREAITQFFLAYTPAWVGGTAYGVILLSVVMTGAALALSIGTIINQDVIQRYTVRFQRDRVKLGVSRLFIFLSILLAYLVVCSSENSLILEWAFLSMTLRGVTLFFPVMAYLLKFGAVHPKWAAFSVWGAPICSLVWAWTLFPVTGIDPFYIGGAVSLLGLLIGKWAKRMKVSLNDSY